MSKYIVFPNGYSGQPKKGHLTFDACFESGECIKNFYLWVCLKRLLFCDLFQSDHCDSVHLIFHQSRTSFWRRVNYEETSINLEVLDFHCSLYYVCNMVLLFFKKNGIVLEYYTFLYFWMPTLCFMSLRNRI